MKNLTQDCIKKCIAVNSKDIEKIIKTETGENVRVWNISNTITFETQYSNDHGKKYFFDILSKYFDVRIISACPCQPKDLDFNLWLEFTE